MNLLTECKCCLTLDACKMIYTLYKPYTKVCKVTHVGQITHFVQDYTLCCIAYKVVLNRKCKIITHYYIFCIHSGKIYTGQKKFTQAAPVVPVTNMRYVIRIPFPIQLVQNDFTNISQKIIELTIMHR